MSIYSKTEKLSYAAPELWQHRTLSRGVGDTFEPSLVGLLLLVQPVTSNINMKIAMVFFNIFNQNLYYCLASFKMA